MNLGRPIHFCLLFKVIIIDYTARHKYIVFTLSFLIYLVIISKMMKNKGSTMPLKNISVVTFWNFVSETQNLKSSPAYRQLLT